MLVLGALRRHARASSEELRRFRDRQLQRVVARAYHEVPYYRRLFQESGLVPEDVRTKADLARVPITTRATFQALPVEDTLARGVYAARLISHSTSGSSGRPITIRRHWVEEKLLATIRLRAMHALGLRASDEVGVVGTTADEHGSSTSSIRRLLAVVRPERWHRIDCALAPAEIFARLRALEVAVLAGYPGALALLARTIDPAELRRLRVRFVSTGGEVLTPAQRADIAAGFGAPVYDSYGSREFDLLALECPQTGAYHVADDGLILEVVRDGRPVGEGERGEVVGTCLHGYAMPFIRYALGDLVTQGAAACSCGQPFSTIREIAGRMIDAFPLPDGRVVHPYGVFIPIRACSPWIRHFQVTQTRIDHVVMRVVAAPAPSADDLARVRRMAAAELGATVRFDLEIVSEIPTEPSGKFRMYRSLIRSDYDPG